MIFRKSDRYYQMTDAQLEHEASRWKIRGYGNSDGTIERNIIIEQLLAKDSARDATVSKILSILSLIIALGGFVAGLYINQKQIADFENSRNSRELDYVFHFDDKLNSGKNYEITLTIE